MRIQTCVAAALLFCGHVYAQTATTAPGVRAKQTYVRRFSFGPTLSVQGLTIVPNRTNNIRTTTPAVDTLYTTNDASSRIGWGGTAQLALTERFALSGSFLIRKLKYTMNTDTYTGVDNINTSVDERTHTVKNEDTRARLYDIPVTIRYYGKDRHEPGARWFVEAGGALRRAAKVRTSIDTTVNNGTTSCCDTTPTPVAGKNIRGFVAGAGVQIMDPVGIKIVPEFRYTRWTGEVFNNQTSTTRRIQLEAVISITF